MFEVHLDIYKYLQNEFHKSQFLNGYNVIQNPRELREN
jgi:hypothetical protein